MISFLKYLYKNYFVLHPMINHPLFIMCFIRKISIFNEPFENFDIKENIGEPIKSIIFTIKNLFFLYKKSICYIITKHTKLSKLEKTNEIDEANSPVGPR